MIAVVIPALNEEKAVSKVVKDFIGEGLKNVYVIDGGSKDNTVAAAKKAGAKLILQRGKGKSDAIRQAFSEIDADMYVIVDADDTYDASAVKKLIEPVKSGTCDMTVGIRTQNEIPKFNRLGNYVFNAFISVSYKYRLRDILSGYRVLSRRLVDSLSIDSQGFGIESEITVEALENNFKIIEVPTLYKPRIGETKLNPLKDGMRIGLILVRLVRDYKPLNVFLGLSAVCMLFGLVFGVRVVIDVASTGEMHFIGSTVLSVLFIIMAVQFFSVGLLADMINRRLRKLEKK